MSSTTNIGTRLRACNCIADAKKVLETVRAGPSTHKLVEIAFALKGQENIKREFIETAIKEVEQKNITKPFSADPGKGEDDVKKLTESGDIVSGTGTDGSEQSSDTEQPYPKEGTDGEVTDMESATGENQMKEGIPGMPPAQIVPGLAPQIAQEMGQQMPPLPQMNTPQMMKQMQYTVQEALKPYRTQLSKITEAVKALDVRLRETETNRASMTLDIGSVKDNAIVKSHPIQETAPNWNDGLPRTTFPRAKLEETRMEILEQDKILSGSQ